MNIYWYKKDLRSFLLNTLPNCVLLSRTNWDDHKRNIVSGLVDYMARHQDVYKEDLLALMAEVVQLRDFSHLKCLEDGTAKARRAEESVAALRGLSEGHFALLKETEEADRRREAAREELDHKRGVRDTLARLLKDYLALIKEEDFQFRGYALERLVRELFDLFDLDPKASFRITGEQIDGAFSFAGTDYLFEAKWRQVPAAAVDLDVLSAKLGRKLDNTLGLFLSVNGFTEDGITAHSSGRRLALLMDGADFLAVLEGRIGLDQLILRKRRHAAQTGNIYLKVSDILSGKD